MMVRELARVHTAEAIDTLVKVLRAKSIPQARVAAARELLDRGHGKAPQVATDLSQISDAELVAEFRRRADARADDARATAGSGQPAGAASEPH